MNILYIITILAIYILFMLMNKTEKKQNLGAWLAISAILIMCYNTFICVILTFIGKLCTLPNLVICNFITIAALVTILLKSKKIQKYYVKILDIISYILILGIVIFIAYIQYKFPFDVKYKTTDGSSHYLFAQDFYENSTLLYKKRIDKMLGVAKDDFRLPGAYTNEGILFKVLDGVLSKTDLFILFDLLVLYLSGILFYNLLKTYAKENKKLNVLALILAIVYMLGYQLNSMLYGYVYLSLALDLVIGFLLLMRNCEKEEISDTKALPILAIMSFGIFFSYAYFIPIIYIAIIIHTIIKSKVNKEKIFSQENIIKLMFLIINPLILGLTYFIILPISNGIESEISTIVVDGLIYKNYITNLLPLIPIIITSIILFIKNKNKEKREVEYSTILFIMSILFAIILFIGHKLGKVSAYYFFKAYYIIWPLAIINTYIALSNILENGNKILKIVTYVYISIYLIAILTTTFLIPQNSIGINDIFHNNLEVATDGKHIFKNAELKILEKVKDKMDNHEIYALRPITKGRIKWISVLHNNEGIYLHYIYEEIQSIDKWIESGEKKYYFAYHRDYTAFEIEGEYLDENSDSYKIIYNDEFGFILERK